MTSFQPQSKSFHLDHVSMSVNRYRIRGLFEEVPPTPPPTADEPKNVSLNSSFPLMKSALLAIDRPRLRDFIPFFPEKRLRAWWPGFPFFTRSDRPIKSHPLVLGPYLPDSRTLVSTPDLQAIEKVYQSHMAEFRNIHRALDIAEGKPGSFRSWTTIDTPIASALLLAFFRGSKRQANRLIEQIKANPAAAYIALHLGRPDQRKSFLETIAADPRLLFDIYTESPFQDVVSDDLLDEVLGKIPHLHILAKLARKKMDDEQAWNALVETAQKDPLSTAFALGLDPAHEQANDWHQTVSCNLEAIYWALRVWTLRHKADEFPHWAVYSCYIKKDIHWLCHWIRDIDRTEAEAVVRWHWPSPWAVEIIADLKMSPALARELYERSFGNAPEGDPWSETLALWAADYIQSKEKNETNENTG